MKTHNEKPLDAVELWMVKSNLEYVKAEGLETVVARLRANGYNRVAAGVEAAVKDEIAEVRADARRLTNDLT